MAVWIERANGARTELQRGLTRFGGRRADHAVEGSGADELQLWDEPPKLIFVGSGDRPEVNGRAVDELELCDGDRIRWRSFDAVFKSTERHARLEPVTESAPRAAPSSPPPPPELRAASAESKRAKRDRPSAREAKPGCLQVALGQTLVLVVATLMVVAVALALRVHWKIDFDALLDQLAQRLGIGR